jgi:hypothetical protein
MPAVATAARVKLVRPPRTHPDGSITLAVLVSPFPDGGRILWTAAAPPERRASETGSCLPFADERMAFEGSRAMRGTSREESQSSSGGKDSDTSVGPFFTVSLRALPNAFYTGLGTHRVPPSLFVTYEHGGRPVQGSVKLADGVPFRSLTYPVIRASAAASMYDIPPTAARSQQDILFASAFPAPPLPASLPSAVPASPVAFWGGKPPV